MPRIQPLSPTTATGPAKDLLEAVQKKMGRVPNILGTMAHAPGVLKSYLDLSTNLGTTSLPARVREQIALAVGNANGCGYCISAHTAIGKGAGLSDAECVAAQRGHADDPKTQAIIDFSLQIVEKRGWVSEGDIAKAHKAGVSDTELIETLGVVILNILTNYFNHLVETEVDFPKVELIKA